MGPAPNTMLLVFSSGFRSSALRCSLVYMHGDTSSSEVCTAVACQTSANC